MDLVLAALTCALLVQCVSLSLTSQVRHKLGPKMSIVPTCSPSMRSKAKLVSTRVRRMQKKMIGSIPDTVTEHTVVVDVSAGAGSLNC